MSSRLLVIWPDERLLRTCKPVTEFGQELDSIAANMLELMKLEHGIGLAAPQVGLDARIFVCDPGADGFPSVFVNPRIIESKGSVTSEEGCLSLPGVTVSVKRAQQVVVIAQHINGDEFRVDATGRYAIVIQHENDHLDGKMMLDATDPASRFLAQQTMRRQK